MSWDQVQVRSYVRQVLREVGDGWNWLTPRVQHALIAEHAFAVVRSQAAETVKVDDMDYLLNAMLEEVGLS